MLGIGVIGQLALAEFPQTSEAVVSGGVCTPAFQSNAFQLNAFQTCGRRGVGWFDEWDVGRRRRHSTEELERRLAEQRGDHRRIRDLFAAEEAAARAAELAEEQARAAQTEAQRKHQEVLGVLALEAREALKLAQEREGADAEIRRCRQALENAVAAGATIRSAQKAQTETQLLMEYLRKQEDEDDDDAVFLLLH